MKFNNRKAPSVLVVDDDPTIVEWLSMALSIKGIKVRAASDAFTAIQCCQQDRPDLVILDLHLGSHAIQGTEVLWHIKNNPALSSIVVLIYTACHDDEVGSLCRDEIGADGYILKGIATNAILVATVHAWLRRLCVVNAKREFSCGPVRVNLAQAQAFIEGETLPLTPREYSLLAYAAKKSPRLVTWNNLSKKLWRMDFDYRSGKAPEEIESCLIHLKSKLGPASQRLVVVPADGVVWVSG